MTVGVLQYSRIYVFDAVMAVMQSEVGVGV